MRFALCAEPSSSCSADFAWRYRSGFKAIAYPRIGVDVARMARVWLNLLPQLVDEDAQVLCFIAVIGPPHRLKQPPVRERFALMGDQMAEQLKLLGRQTNRASSHSYFSSFEINCKVRRNKRRLGSPGRRAPQCRADAGQQLLHPERLHHIRSEEHTSELQSPLNL